MADEWIVTSDGYRVFRRYGEHGLEFIAQTAHNIKERTPTARRNAQLIAEIPKMRERIEALHSALRDANDLIYVAEKLAKSGEYAGACRRWQEAARKLLESK